MAHGFGEIDAFLFFHLGLYCLYYYDSMSGLYEADKVDGIMVSFLIGKFI